MPPNSADRDAELLRRIRDGDAAAFEVLYEAYRRPLANLFYRLSPDRALVDDLLQETFVRIWRGARMFRGDSRASTFLFRIAINVWNNEARRTRPREAPQETPAPAPPETAERAEAGVRVRAALGRLPARDRAVVILSEYNGLSYEEIGEILEIPVGTAKSRMFRALRTLREQLKDRV